MLKAIQVIKAVQLSAMQFWRYVVSPLPTPEGNEACDLCKSYAGRRFTRREAEATFKDLEKHSSLIWYPHVHPNCRCELWLEEEGELAYPFKPIPADDYK